jgi:hypothetical protein
MKLPDVKPNIALSTRTNAATRMSVAQAKVFSLPEIVENILRQLPLEDLLVITPFVCQAWNKRSSSSPFLDLQIRLHASIRFS